MQALRHILIVMDPTHETQVAFEKALSLAEETGADLTLLTCMFDDQQQRLLQTQINSDEDRENITDAYRGVIQDKISALTSNCVITEHIVRWNESIIDSVTEASERHVHFDLIVKETKPHHVMVDKFVTPSDWQLLRKSIYPVMLVKADHHREETLGNQPKRALVAVDSTAPDGDHIQLNENLLSAAEHFQGFLNHEVYLVNAYPFVTMGATIEPTPVLMQTIQENLHKHHLDATMKLADYIRVNRDHVFVEQGEAFSVIPDVAKQMKADLVIIGTVAREGIANFLDGNTSESIADYVDADILALKPTHAPMAIEDEMYV